jgi:hypothetical protein
MTFHLYRISELYSNADGSVQFIELTTTADGQNFLGGHTITDTQGGTTHSFTFPTDLPSGATANTTVLIATQGFADLGIVKPDYIIPAGFLFSNGGTFNYAGVDAVTYAQLPSDGLTAIDRNGNAVSAVATDFGGASSPLTAVKLTLSIMNDDFAITRTALPVSDATSVASAIKAGMETESQYVNGLLSQVADTTIPAVAVEGSMYNAVGSSTEVTKLVTQFLPAQVANAVAHGLVPQVYACEVVGLAFAFGDENGGMAFDTNYGPANAQMPATSQGDQAFAAAAASTIFGSAANAGTPTAILGFVSNWEAFYTQFGVPGIANATADQIVLAARAAAWGDAVGVALANNLGSLPGQVTNFLEDAAQGTAMYSASLASQPTASAFQGAAAASHASTASEVQLTGVASPMLSMHDLLGST